MRLRVTLVPQIGFLAGLKVHEIRGGYSLRLIVSDEKWLDENDVEIVMEAPCLVIDSGGAEHHVERDKLDTIPALLALQSLIIEKISAENGTLRAVFDDGSVLTVLPLDQYEAWRIEGPGDGGAVCMPAGELVVWDG